MLPYGKIINHFFLGILTYHQFEENLIELVYPFNHALSQQFTQRSTVSSAGPAVHLFSKTLTSQAQSNVRTSITTIASILSRT